MAQDQFCMSFPLSFPRNGWKWCLHIKYSGILSSWLTLNHPVSFVFPLALEKVYSSLPFLKTICQKSPVCSDSLSIECYLSCIEKEMCRTASPWDNIPSIVVQQHLVKLPNFMNQNIGSTVNFIDVYVKVFHSCFDILALIFIFFIWPLTKRVNLIVYISPDTENRSYSASTWLQVVLHGDKCLVIAHIALGVPWRIVC